MKLNENFTVIPNSIIQGVVIKDMSVIALYCFLRSHSTGFSYNWTNVKKSLNIGKGKYYESLKLLEKYGYIQTSQTKQKNGQFGKANVLIYGRDYFELPCAELPYTVKRDTDTPYTVIQYNNNIKSNNDKINNKVRENEIKTLSHFEYLDFNFKDEIKELVTKYKPKINDWDICIKKFNNKYKTNFSIIVLEGFLSNWAKINSSISINVNNGKPKAVDQPAYMLKPLT
jgi:hypothetical protein